MSDRSAIILKHVEDGLTFKEISERLGITRGAVSGIVTYYRDQLSPATQERLSLRHCKSEEKPRRDLGTFAPVKTCQWLYGEGKDRNFCGEEVQPGSSYCAKHHAICHVSDDQNEAS